LILKVTNKDKDRHLANLSHETSNSKGSGVHTVHIMLNAKLSEN